MSLDKILDKLEVAMETWFRAKQEHDKALEEYDGYSWDWYGAGYIQDMEYARQEYRKLFKEAVSAQIEEDKKNSKI